MATRDIEDVIEELVVATLASAVVPERERSVRRSNEADLARPDDEPRVQIDPSLCEDIDRSVACGVMAAGTIPPPIGPHCLVSRLVNPEPDALADTDRVHRVAADEDDEIEIEIS